MHRVRRPVLLAREGQVGGRLLRHRAGLLRLRRRSPPARSAATRNRAGPWACMEKLSTCLALIEIVNSCNLACPTCLRGFAGRHRAKVDAVPLADLQRRIQGVIDRKGKIEILQLSGGEPTLHPQFFELLRWLHANPKIDYVLLNTNGVRIAHDDVFAAELAATFRYGQIPALSPVRRPAGGRAKIRCAARTCAPHANAAWNAAAK